MYPNLYFALKQWFGVEWQWARIFNSFGLLLALSFVCAAIVLHKEFKRKKAQGFFEPMYDTVVVGKPASIAELLVQFIVGFFIGYKFIGGFVDGGLQLNAQSYIASKQGNIWCGLAIGAVFTYLKWHEKNKQKLDVPITKKIALWPHDRVGDITILAAISGLLGAKFFHFLENWSTFIKDPWGNITAFGGLTFYGGLIVAAIVLLWYAYSKKIPWKHLVDAVAPGLMIAYAVGRLGCQISGDGDWGIFNSAYISTPDAKVVLADSTNNFDKALTKNAEYTQYFNRIKEELAIVPHKSFAAPSYLPTWLVAMNYTHNVNEEGVRISNSKEEQFATMLPVPVFPTPLYEFVICSILFLILWLRRKAITTPGVLFGIYLMMNGAERFIVEKIRVNTEYHLLGFRPSQAELISTALFVLGAVIIWRCKAKKTNPQTA